MDPFNKLIIENKKYIHYIFINNHHKYLLKQNNFNEKNILIYKDILEKKNLLNLKKYYKNILFIGRLSKKKYRFIN